MPLQTPKAYYTFADCLTRDESKHIEIIPGEAIVMLHLCASIRRFVANYRASLRTSWMAKRPRPISSPLPSACLSRTEFPGECGHACET